MLIYVIVTYFTMNPSQLNHPSTTHFERDRDKCLFDPAMRNMFANFGPGNRLPAVEALGALRRAAKALHLLMERWAELHGLSEGRLQILVRLRHQPQVALGELAAMVDVSPRNVTGLIDALERDGLVERVPDPSDRRSIQARLTPSGRERIESIWKLAFEHQLPIVEGLSDHELTQLRHLCLRLVENVNALGKGESL